MVQITKVRMANLMPNTYIARFGALLRKHCAAKCQWPLISDSRGTAARNLRGRTQDRGARKECYTNRFAARLRARNSGSVISTEIFVYGMLPAC
jgi:hypothetical protein